MTSHGEFTQSKHIQWKGAAMKTGFRTHILLIAVILGISASGDTNEESSDPDAVLGIWETAHTENGYSRVEIYETDGEYKGRIIWLSNPLYPEDDEEGEDEVPV